MFHRENLPRISTYDVETDTFVDASTPSLAELMERDEWEVIEYDFYTGHKEVLFTSWWLDIAENLADELQRIDGGSHHTYYTEKIKRDHANS